GVTLTLAPGTTLTLAAADGMGAGVDTSRTELTVLGNLVANGTAASPITLTSAGTWYGLRNNVGGQSYSWLVINNALNGLELNASATVTDTTVTASSVCVRVNSGTATLSRL